MKKILMSFLMMVMIAGCVQAPSEEAKQEQVVFVDKVDDLKDWVYVETSETFDLYSKKDQKPFRKMLEDMVSTQGDVFYNWYNTVYTPTPELTLFKININSDDAKEVNNQINKLYEEKLTAVGHQYLSYRSFLSEDILSVVVKYGSFIPGSDCVYEFVAYNFDLNDGKLISNIDLLKRFSLNTSDVRNKLIDYYNSQGAMVSCDEAESEKEQAYCYTRTDLITDERINHYVLFVEDDSLYFMGYIYDSKIHYNYIKIKIN